MLSFITLGSPAFSQPIDLSLEWTTNNNIPFLTELENTIEDEVAVLPTVKGIIVIYKGQVVLENYYNPCLRKSPWKMYRKRTRKSTEKYCKTFFVYRVIFRCLITVKNVPLQIPYSSRETASRAMLSYLLPLKIVSVKCPHSKIRLSGGAH